MKTKLLKKIRKRYSWYLNSNQCPVLLDNYKKTVIIINNEYLCDKLKYTDANLKNIEVSHAEWQWRWLKTIVLGQYGWKFNKHMYRSAKGIFNMYQNNNSRYKKIIQTNEPF